MNIPRVVVNDWDADIETKIFLKFLHNVDFPTHRTFIIDAFPNLRYSIDNASSARRERTIVRKFLDDFYTSNSAAIDAVVQKSRRRIKRDSREGLRVLSASMGYTWKKQITYEAFPTILPFSPFGTNCFYFSILSGLVGGRSQDVLMIALHEISHFIFFDYLKKIERPGKFILAPDARHYLKEALTAAVFNEEPVKNFLDIATYAGNPEIRGLYVRKGSSPPMQMLEWIRARYRRCVLVNEKSFTEFLAELAKTVYQKRAKFAQKRAFWNKYGKSVLADNALRKQYERPIKLD